MSLKAECYYGVVLEDLDPLNLGRYKVHIDELHMFLPPNEGQWCHNRIHNYRINYDKRTNVYGEYKPLQAGTTVLVTVFNADWNSSSITQIISDIPDSKHPSVMPFGVKDRDDFYLLIRTAKYDSIISVSEDSVDEPARTLHIYHNGTSIIMDKDGIHINATNQNVSLSGDCNVNIAGNCNLQTGGQVNVKSSSNVNIDGNQIFLNSGKSQGNAGYNTTSSAKELIKR